MLAALHRQALVACRSPRPAGGAFSIGATALAITGVAIPSWTASTVGDATVTAGLWAVCSVSVPFIDDMCDGIIEPSPSLIGARFLSVLQCVVGFLTICWAALTVILLPYSAMLFVTLLFTIASAVLGVFAVITFGESGAWVPWGWHVEARDPGLLARSSPGFSLTPSPIPLAQLPRRILSC